MDSLPKERKAEFVRDFIRYRQEQIVRTYAEERKSKFTVAMKTNPQSDEIIDPWKESTPVRVAASASPGETVKPWKETKPSRTVAFEETEEPWKKEPAPQAKPEPKRPVEEQKPEPKRRTVAVVAPVVKGPSSAAPAKQRRLPKEIVEGAGTSRHRWGIYRTSAELDRLLQSDKMSDAPVVLPITLDMGEHGTYYFHVNFRLEEVSKKNLDKTLNDLSRVLKETMAAKGVPSSVYSRSITGTVNSQIRTKIMAYYEDTSDVGKYLRSH